MKSNFILIVCLSEPQTSEQEVDGAAIFLRALLEAFEAPAVGMRMTKKK